MFLYTHIANQTPFLLVNQVIASKLQFIHIKTNLPKRCHVLEHLVSGQVFALFVVQAVISVCSGLTFHISPRYCQQYYSRYFLPPCYLSLRVKIAYCSYGPLTISSTTWVRNKVKVVVSHSYRGLHPQRTLTWRLERAYFLLLRFQLVRRATVMSVAFGLGKRQRGSNCFPTLKVSKTTSKFGSKNRYFGEI